ncbi:MAG: sulfotransferase [Bacteroidales bacterium]|nr:sulfotransferase [Bacteroidales bacterium]
MMEERNLRRSPWWVRGVNKAWKGSYFLGTKVRLNKDDLIKTAKKRTGLTDLGKDFNDEPLERVLTSIEQEARLHPVGRFITRERFIGLLNIRLRAEYYFGKYPAILDQELYPAWIIIGLQRTGTTKLQRLLAVDPNHRVIPSWEIINPVPLDLNFSANPASSAQYPPHPLPLPLKEKGDSSAQYPDPARVKIANTSVNALRFLSPDFFTIHPIDAMQPEEDILLLDISFLSTTPEAMMHVPSYSSWLEKTDQSVAYEYAVKLLKFLQWVKPAKRWILKTPHHLEFPHLIEKCFGEVHFLWPHRSIYESVPSFLDMVTHNRMIFSGDVDVKQVAGHWVRKMGYMLDKALEYRLLGNNEQKFTDLNYKDLVNDSIGQLSEIYKLNGGLTPELIAAFRKHEEENPHRKNGTHRYSLDDFGLTEADVDRYTAHYQQFVSQRFKGI